MSAGGTKPERNKPWACSVASHWQSAMSVLRPGKFRTCRPLTTNTLILAASRVSYRHSQYMQVASTATEPTPSACNHATSPSRSRVMVPNTRGQSPAIDTCKCSLPTSIPLWNKVGADVPGGLNRVQPYPAGSSIAHQSSPKSSARANLSHGQLARARGYAAVLHTGSEQLHNLPYRFRGSSRHAPHAAVSPPTPLSP